jgi:hypothetical protein
MTAEAQLAHSATPGAAASAPASLLWTGPLLVGRDAELARVLQHLDAGAPRVIGIAAGPSFGKTLFLSAIEAAAREKGWAAVRRDPDGASLTIETGTTEAALVQQLRNLIGMTGRREPDRVTGSDPAVPAARALVQDLVAGGPCVLLIDDFRPSEAVRAWLATRFLAELRAAPAPLLVVAAGLPDAIEPLRGAWDDVLVLGRLPANAVRAHFESIAPRCRPPLTAAEVAAYVEDSLEKPHVLNALTRLLAQLTTAQSGGGST